MARFHWGHRENPPEVLDVDLEDAAALTLGLSITALGNDKIVAPVLDKLVPTLDSNATVRKFVDAATTVGTAAVYRIILGVVGLPRWGKWGQLGGTGLGLGKAVTAFVPNYQISSTTPFDTTVASVFGGTAANAAANAAGSAAINGPAAGAALVAAGGTGTGVGALTGGGSAQAERRSITMPYKVRSYPNSVASTKSGAGGGGGFTIPLDRIPGTCTEMWIKVVANITASGASGTFDDTWDRLVQQMSLVYSTQNYFNFADMTMAQHLCRFKGLAAPRITFPASPTTQNYTIWYPLHFGMVPYVADKVTGRLQHNPFDLSAGIPQLPANSLQLTGTYGTSAQLATSGITVNNIYIQPYFTYITNLPNESPDQFQPLAFPSWYTESEAQYVAATSSAFGTNIPLPIGDWIQAALHITRSSATNNPRSDAVLNSMQFFDQTGQRKIFSANTWNDFVAFTQLSRLGNDNSAVPTDGPTLGTVVFPPSNVPFTLTDTIGGFTNTMFTNTGLGYVDMRDWISQPDPLLGLNMDPAINPFTQLQWQSGITSGSASQSWQILYLKYKKNAAASAPAANLHPAVARALMSGS